MANKLATAATTYTQRRLDYTDGWRHQSHRPTIAEVAREYGVDPLALRNAVRARRSAARRHA